MGVQRNGQSGSLLGICSSHAVPPPASALPPEAGRTQVYHSPREASAPSKGDPPSPRNSATRNQGWTRWGRRPGFQRSLGRVEK